MSVQKQEAMPRLEKTAEWRGCFTDEVLHKAEQLLPSTKFILQKETDSYISCRVCIRNQRIHDCMIHNIPRYLTDTWSQYSFHCNCGSYWERCIHEALFMLYYENLHGPFKVTESDSAYKIRLENTRRNQELMEMAGTRIPAGTVFPEWAGEKGPVFLDLEAATQDLSTNAYFVKQYQSEVIANNTFHPAPYFHIDTHRDGTKTMLASLVVREITGDHKASFELTGNRFAHITCNCPQYALLKDSSVLCDHMLRLIAAAWKYIRSQSMEDLTDHAARDFFTHYARLETSDAQPAEETIRRRADVDILPRVSLNADGEPLLSFKVGLSGRKMFVLRNLVSLVSAYRRREDFELSKKEHLAFSEHDVAPDSRRWLDFISQRIDDIESFNEMSNRRNYYSVRDVSVSASIPLQGSVLDRFYELADGSSCEYQDKANSDINSKVIPVGYRKLSLHLVTSRLSDARGQFMGVIVSGYVPLLIAGANSRYQLNHEGISRVTPEEERIMAPFAKVANATGFFRLQIGIDHLQEYYYRILPSLMENPYVQVDDQAGEEAQQYLPPEPVFTFYADLVDGIASVRCTVAYQDQTRTLEMTAPADHAYRDEIQEERVRQMLQEQFPNYSRQTGTFSSEPLDDESLYLFLRDGLALLGRYGEVRVTDAIRGMSIRKAPVMTVGVSVESGIMDLSITSKDMSPQELLSVLESYHRRKRFHRLKSGEFVDLQDDSQLQEIDTFLGSMDLMPTDVIRQKAHLPLYRALYLDRMLEDHEALASTRDRTYRALIKNFKTIQEADFEVPASMEDTLRPYQTYGYKWLRTLENAGFGGILADEMGLGKTLQMIAVFMAAKESHATLPSLVVCPASLVYNWQEEIRRFAPDLNCQVIAGGLPARKKIIQSLDVTQADVYVTSYDLLKRDVSLYESAQFHTCVLDEAQYIKNQKAAISRSVKVLHAQHRYALTGTPIENRLSELWSIFDFLMPGFLYSSQEFITRFETPIARDKDEQMTARLKKMVGPFILRRLKTDVLKDLPAKLEEVRYARLDDEQQQLYDGQVVHMKQLIASTTSTSGEDRIRILAELTRIRQICCDPSLLFEDYHGASAKREACIELVQSAIDGGHRMLIFSQFTSMLSLLEEDLQRENIPYFKIIGATPKDKRIRMVHEFNEGTVPVFLISLKSGGTGLNLTGADVVIHYDPWWNLAAQNQATDRAHRIGQTRQVTVYKLIARNTIEEKILELQNAKQDLADAILEGRSESLMSLSNEELLALLS